MCDQGVDTVSGTLIYIAPHSNLLGPVPPNVEVKAPPHKEFLYTSILGCRSPMYMISLTIPFKMAMGNINLSVPDTISRYNSGFNEGRLYDEK